MTLQNVLEIINSAGVVGLLIFIVLAFYRGDLISKPLLDKILDRYMAKMDEMFADIKNKLDSIKGSDDKKREW